MCCDVCVCVCVCCVSQSQPNVYFEGMDPAKEQASIYMDQVVKPKEVRHTHTHANTRTHTHTRTQGPGKTMRSALLMPAKQLSALLLGAPESDLSCERLCCLGTTRRP